jgi:hypothetical protein
MAERSQKKMIQPNAKEGKIKDKKEVDKLGAAHQHEGKKPLRLEDRKRLEIEKKKAHKMMRQISDSESSSDEQRAAGKRNVVPDSEDDDTLVGDHNGVGGKKKVNYKTILFYGA